MSSRRMDLASIVAQAVVLVALVGPGCSAIVQPDPSRLGGVDAPGLDAPGIDIGPRPDVPMLDGGPDAPLECTSDGMCNDMIACTRDQCRGNRCTYTADDGECPDGQRCAAEVGCVPILCTSNPECSDGDMCNGMERCAPGAPGADPETGCVEGMDLACDDGISCTEDTCDATRGCTFTRQDSRCDDSVGCTIDVCTATAGPSGCENRPDDTRCGDVCIISRCTDMGCGPAAPRPCEDGTDCTADSCDASAPDGCVFTPLDADGDDAIAAVSPSGRMCAGGTDCDDRNPDIRPGAPERCNGVDDNCDGTRDEGCPTVPDDCASAIALVEGAPGMYTARGMFGDLAVDYPGSCPGTGRDAVYYVDITSVSDVRIDTVGSAVADTVLSVSTTCDDAAFAVCNDDQDPGSVLTSRMWVHNAVASPDGPVRLYILVKAFEGTATGAYQLNVRVSPISPDTCTAPLDISGGGTVVGLILPTPSSTGVRGSCDMSASATNEALHRFTGPSDGSVAELRADSATFVPVLFTRSTCSNSSSETSCDVGPAARVTSVPASSGSRHTVFVDGAPRTAGSVSTYVLNYDP